MTNFRILATIVLIGFLGCACDAITNNVVPTRLYSFTGGADGGIPESWLIQASDGGFYGTTSQGGANNTGTIFQITSAGTLTTLYSFGGTNDGATPVAGLFQGSDSNFYGMTTRGGVNDTGTVFQITSAGTLTTLYGFTGGADGGYPLGGIIQGNDGNFYGTTSEGGANRTGTIFQITTAGTLTTLYSFTGGADGAIPEAGLVQGSDSNFYGTTSIGGSNAFGTVFSITTNGVFTSIYQLNKSDGRYPAAALIQASDGLFYGTARRGGSRGDGTAFKVSSAGTFTVLYHFGGSEGRQPGSSLLQAQDGLFYGTTLLGGYRYGTLFQMDSNGVFHTLNRFLGDTQGGDPYASVVQGTDKYFYGTTGFGGPGLHGTVFRFTAFPGGTYTGLVLQTNALSAATSGFLNLNLRFTGYFKAKLTIGNKSSAFKGTLNPSGIATNIVPPNGPNPLQLIFQLSNVGGGTNVITGTVSNGVFNSEFLTDAAGVFVNTNPCPQRGKFTFVIAPANTNDATVPQGFGIGTVTVAKLGKLRIRGFLGDGTPFHANGPISGIGTYPLYATLYSGKLGSVLGQINLPVTNEFGVLATATLDWFKPAAANNTFYRAGFTTMPTFECAAYIPPTKGGPSIATTNATVTIAGGNLSSPIVKNVTIDSTGSVTVSNPGSDNLSMAIAPTTGLFRGSFVHPAVSKPVDFTGYLLQTTNEFGAGIFFGTDQTGYVLIQATP